MAHCFICVCFPTPAIFRPSQKKSENDIWYRKRSLSEEWACDYWKGTFECCAWPSDRRNQMLSLSICKNTATQWETTLRQRLKATKGSPLTNPHHDSMHLFAESQVRKSSCTPYRFSAAFHLSKNKPPALRPCNSNSILILQVHVKHTNGPLYYGRTKKRDVR